MKFLAFGALLNVGGAAAWGPSPTFDCAMRKLAYTYGKQLLPRMGEYESLYYALDLNDTTCSTPMASNAASSGKVARAPAPLPLGAKLFVDPTAGSDASKLGAMESPLRTVQEALNRAAIIEPTPAVVLREGTHYIADSLLLTPAHSNLHMLGYPGETATISGGIVLTNLDWKPYVTPTPAPASEWTTEDNDDYVWSYVGGDPNFPTLGKPASKEACQALCAAHKDCHAYTWHDTNQGGYSLMCVGRLDGAYVEHQLSGHYSGHDASATPYPPAGTPNIYVTSVNSPLVEAMTGLQMNGERATIARYPNQPGGVETSCGYDCVVAGGSADWTPPDMNKYGNVTYYTDLVPAHERNDSAAGGGLDNWFSHYMIGVNGLCYVYDPPVSYWCSEYTSGGGASAFRTPSGVTPHAGALPNSPYADASQALFFVWRPARWANWMFEIESHDATTGTYAFGKGGNQGARGNDAGGDFYIQDVFEELDYPGEYFFNRTTRQLYFWYNGTGAPPADATFVAPKTQVLLNATGTQWIPVTNIKLENLVYVVALAFRT